MYQTYEESLKDNLLNLVKDHRQHCNANCNISLFQIYKLAQKAGIIFTEEERELFI